MPWDHLVWPDTSAQTLSWRNSHEMLTSIAGGSPGRTYPWGLQLGLLSVHEEQLGRAESLPWDALDVAVSWWWSFLLVCKATPEESGEVSVSQTGAGPGGSGVSYLREVRGDATCMESWVLGHRASPYTVHLLPPTVAEPDGFRGCGRVFLPRGVESPGHSAESPVPAGDAGELRSCGLPR